MRTAGETGDRGADAVAGGLLITGSQAGERTTVEALRLADGMPVWWYDSRLRLSDLTCLDGVVCVSSVGRPRPGSLGPAAVVGLRARDGTLLWRLGPAQLRRQMAQRRVTWGLRALWMTSSPAQARQVMQSLELAGSTYLAVSDDMALVCKQQAIFGLSMRSGALRWVMPTLSGMGRPLIASGGHLVYIQSDSGTLDALDARTGRKRWSSEGKLHVEFDADTLAVSETQVCLFTTHGRQRTIMTLRLADGGREQTLPLAEGETPVRVTSDGLAYVMRGARLRAVRMADGAELWQSAPLWNVPDAEREAFARSVRLVVGEHAVFYGYEMLTTPVHHTVVGALDKSSGAPLWDWRGPERSLPLSGAPSLHAAQGNIFAITSAGVFAFNGADGRLLWQAPGDAAISRAVLSIDPFLSS